MTKMVSASEHERRALDNEDDVDAVLECSEPEDERREESLVSYRVTRM